MKNRAKCKLCQSVIESFHSTDYVQCQCGHIAVNGGDLMYCSALDWSNFIRITDDDKEIEVKVIEKDAVKHTETNLSLTKKEKIAILDDMVTQIQKMPPHALALPITHYDYLSLLFLLKSLFSDDESP